MKKHILLLVGVLFCLGISVSAESLVMQVISNATTGQIEIFDAGKPVLHYNYQTVEPGAVLKKIAPNNRKYALPRSDYIHPLYNLNGKELTRDWAVDHPHHRGIYWAWPEVVYGGISGDLHALQKVFARPTGKLRIASGTEFAQIAAENQWLWDDREPIVRELAIIRAYHATEQGRAIDLTLQFTALKEGVTIARRGLTHYGGLNIRMATSVGQTISTFTDSTNSMPRAWSDLSGTFSGSSMPSGLMVFPHPRNPDPPVEWVQFPNLAWCQPTFPATGMRYALKRVQPLVLRYRLYVHAGGKPDDATAAKLWDAYSALEVTSTGEAAP